MLAEVAKQNSSKLVQNLKRNSLKFEFREISFENYGIKNLKIEFIEACRSKFKNVSNETYERN